MWQKISALMSYLTIAGYIKDLKNDERGLSGVVVAVLLILVGVLAVAVVWFFLGEWIVDLWLTITEKSKIE